MLCECVCYYCSTSFSYAFAEYFNSLTSRVTHNEKHLCWTNFQLNQKIAEYKDIKAALSQTNAIQSSAEVEVEKVAKY